VVGTGAGDPSYFRPSSPASSARGHGSVYNQGLTAPTQSDGELSDLDLMSDYAPSESDLGNESDSSWSMAGGSNAASPRLGANSNLARGGTVRDSRGGQFLRR